MKLISAVILSIMLLSNNLRVSFVYGWYALDMDSFVEKLCENKDKPEMQCNGKCYLTKMTANTSNKDSNKVPEIKWEQLVYCSVEVSTSEPSVKHKTNAHQFWYASLHSDTISSSIFHPPRYS